MFCQPKTLLPGDSALFDFFVSNPTGFKKSSKSDQDYLNKKIVNWSPDLINK